MSDVGFSPPQRVFASLRDTDDDKSYPQIATIDVDSVPHAKSQSRKEIF
jgi:hypothetical protein